MDEWRYGVHFILCVFDEVSYYKGTGYEYINDLGKFLDLIALDVLELNFMGVPSSP